MADERDIDVSIIQFFTDLFLFSIKIFTGLLSNSYALIADGVHNLVDLVESLIFLISSNIKFSKRAFFSYYSAGPIAGLVLAVFSGIFGFEVIRASFVNYSLQKSFNITIISYLVAFFSVLVEFFMFLHFSNELRRKKSLVILDKKTDALSDIFVSSGVLLSLFIIDKFNYFAIDSFMSSLIGLFIIYQGFVMGARNITFLMGGKAEKSFIEKVRKKINKIDGVKEINDVKGFYSGNKINVEVFITLDEENSLKSSEKIINKIKREVKEIKDVNKVFIHFSTN